MAYTVITNRRRVVRADFAGGNAPYIELTFGSTGYAPTEVINVYDCDTGKSELAGLTGAALRARVRAEVLAWIQSVEEDGWHDWYEGYLENARYSR